MLDIEIDKLLIKYNITNLEELDLLLKSVKNLREGIAWRKASYEQELAAGHDQDGWPLSETNRLILENLRNIMIAFESYFEK